jgi:hypothetical protein
MEGADVPVGMDIELQRFKFYTPFIRHILELEHGKIRLSGFRAQAGKFGDINSNRIIPRGAGVIENLELTARIVIKFCGFI